MEQARTQDCPDCGTTLPVVDGYPAWCHSCGWNLHAPDREPPRTIVDRAYAYAGRKLGDRLIDELRTAQALEPRPTPSKVAAYAIALLVHAVALAPAASGIAWAAASFPNPWAIGLGALGVAVSIALRPRLGKVPKNDVLNRAEAPALYRLADEVAAAIGTRPVDVIAVEANFNASWATLGLRRRRVLTLGLPMLTALAPQERVALVAHELAHARNGDSSRGVIVGSALGTLGELYTLLAPGGDETDVLGLGFIANGVMWLLSRPVLALLLLQLHLLLRDSQRAEYLADALAARAAGTDATVGLHEKTLLESTFRSVVQHAASPGTAIELFDAAREALTSVPDRERERRRRVARLEAARLSDTHPPSARRIELLETRQHQLPAVVLTPADSTAIDDELRRFRRPFQESLIEDHRDQLYY